MNNRVNEHRITINQILVIVLAALAIFTPLFRYQKMVILVVLFTMWFISAIVVDTGFMRSCAGTVVLLIGILVLDLLRGVFCSDTSYIVQGINKMPTFMWIIILQFYSRNTIKAKRMVFPVLVMFAISSFFTIKGNVLYPGASRMLANALEYYANIRNQYINLNIGGYGYAYACVFMILPLLVYLSTKNKQLVKIIFLPCILIFTVTISGYFIGLILSIAYVVVFLVKPKNMHRYIISILVFLIIVLLCRDLILELLIRVGNALNQEAIVKHASELMTGSYFQDETTYSRLTLFKNALQNWLDNPVFGSLFTNNITRGAGHSALLEYLQNYGVFSFVYFSLYKKVYKTVLNKIQTQKIKNWWILYFFVLIMFLLFDIIDSFCALGFVVFFFGPILMIMADEEYSLTTINT